MTFAVKIENRKEHKEKYAKNTKKTFENYVNLAVKGYNNKEQKNFVTLAKQLGDLCG